jgi:hypothetical protein
MDSRQRERRGKVPVFTAKPIDQLGTQLCPGSIATATPQAFTVASPPARQAGYGVDHPTMVMHCTPAHIHQI